MLLKISLFDAARYLRASVRISLDWKQKKWSLVEDDAQSSWQRVGFTKEGPFEPRPSGAIWLWDKEHLHACICSVECTFCADCADGVLGGRCPNCGGVLLPRSPRPAALLDRFPASTDRVFRPEGCAPPVP
jgi:hypothetical protein